MNKKMTLFIYLILLPAVLFGQIERWIYRYNGPGDSIDFAKAIVYGADGNIYVVGQSYVNSTNGWDFTVIGLTSTGTERWVYTYNGPANSNEQARSIVYGADGNIYVAGISIGIGTGVDLAVISLTSSGTERWVYTYNGLNNNKDEAHSIVYGADGNIYVAGEVYTSNSNYQDFTVISLTSSGTERWVYTYHGGIMFDVGYSIVYGGDGNIYAAGYTMGVGTITDFTVISLKRTTGAERWIYKYNGMPSNSGDIAFSIVYGLDGNIYAAGYTTSSNYYTDFTVISLSTAGAERWIYKNYTNYDDMAEAVIYGQDGNIYAAGYRAVSSTKFDLAVISITNTGTQNWVYTYNGPGNDNDRARQIVYGQDGNIYAGGWSIGAGTGSDFTVTSLTNTGTERWVYRYNGPANMPDQIMAMVNGQDGNIYAAGVTDGSSPNEDLVVISLEPTLVGVEEYSSNQWLEVSPEILNSFFINKIVIRFASSINFPLKIAIYDAIGRKVYETSIFTTISDFLILSDKTISNLPRGIYFLSISGAEKIYSVIKLVKP